MLGPLSRMGCRLSPQLALTSRFRHRREKRQVENCNRGEYRVEGDRVSDRNRKIQKENSG